MTQDKSTPSADATEPGRRLPEAEELLVAKQQIRVYAELQQLLVELANRLVALPAERLFGELTEVLHQLADAVDVDRVMLILFDERTSEISCHAEWHREDIRAAMPLMQRIPISVVIDLFKPLQAGRVVLIEAFARQRQHGRH